MNGNLEHRECAEELAAYALGALSDEEAARVRGHLSECRECSNQLDWLRGGVEVLSASVRPVEPPPELRTRLMETVNAEAELLHATATTHGQPTKPPWWRRRPPAVHIGLIVAGACAIAAVAIVLALGGGSGTRTIRAQITDPALRATVRASLLVRGGQAALLVRGLPIPVTDHVDELWVKRGSSAPAPAGTFLLHSGSVAVGRPVRDGDLVLVTVEPGRGTTAPTTEPLIVVKV